MWQEEVEEGLCNHKTNILVAQKEKSTKISKFNEAYLGEDMIDEQKIK